MTLNEYQQRAGQTAIYPNAKKLVEAIDVLKQCTLKTPGIQEAIGILENSGTLYCALGLGESGEVQGKVKKIMRDLKGPITDEVRKQLCDELGDVLWYVSQAAAELGLPLSLVAETNLAKLADRQARNKLEGSGDTR